jgi:hypothetical protein
MSQKAFGLSGRLESFPRRLNDPGAGKFLSTGGKYICSATISVFAVIYYATEKTSEKESWKHVVWLTPSPPQLY